MWSDVRYFNREELMCEHCGAENMNKEFMKRLDFVRYIYKKPMVVTSGYRCVAHDDEIGGKGNHPQGDAADIRVNKGKDMYDFIAACIKAGIRRIILYKDSGHVHIDMNPDKQEGVFIL